MSVSFELSLVDSFVLSPWEKRVKSPRVIPWQTKQVEEAAHQLIEMVISGTDSQSVVFVINGMGSGVVKERALELWLIVFAFWENTSEEGMGLKLCKMIFGSRLLS
ncbi:hypothetical protein Q3G72_006737 [Acer saccharum]|nr:hypothetical protein Q3G72_006737 [Acer saccharum]